MEFNREQIEHTLEICSSGDEQCAYCCLLAFDGCARKLAKLALALIRELTEEVAKAKADTVRKMQEKFSMILALGEEVDTDRAVDFLAEIAKEILEEETK